MLTWNPKVENALKNLLESSSSPKVALFDVDGTLWPDDLGEAFFKHQILNGYAPGAVNMQNPWEHYIMLDKASVADANAWITKLNAGVKLGELRQQARDYYQKSFSTKLNPLVKQLILDLRSRDFDVWLCTASMRWAVEPVMYELDLPLENLVGTESEVDERGVLTNIIKTPLPYAEGKREAMASNLASAPTLVAGNSMGDLSILNWAVGLPLVIQYEPPKPEIIGSERALRREAEQRGWLLQTFNFSQVNS